MFLRTESLRRTTWRFCPNTLFSFKPNTAGRPRSTQLLGDIHSEEYMEFTHRVSGESSEHDRGEALVQRGHALLPDQLPQNVTETVGVFPFRSWRRRSPADISDTASVLFEHTIL